MLTCWNVDSNSNQEGLTELPISCPNGQYLNKFQYMPSNSDSALSNKTRYREEQQDYRAEIDVRFSESLIP